MPCRAFQIILFYEQSNSLVSDSILSRVFGGFYKNRQLVQHMISSRQQLLGKQSQSGNIRFTVGQYWLIIKINGTNSVNFGRNSVNFVGNMLSNRNFS